MKVYIVIINSTKETYRVFTDKDKAYEVWKDYVKEKNLITMFIPLGDSLYFAYDGNGRLCYVMESTIEN